MPLVPTSLRLIELEKKAAKGKLSPSEQKEFEQLKKEHQETLLRMGLNPKAKDGPGDKGLKIEKEPKVERSEADTPRVSLDEFAAALKAAKEGGTGNDTTEKLVNIKKMGEGGVPLRITPAPKKEEKPITPSKIDEEDPYVDLTPLQKAELKSIDDAEKKELKKVEPKFE